MPQDTKEITQFEHIDHEQVAEKQQGAMREFKENFANQKAAYKKRATLHGAIGGEEQQKRAQSILEYQTEVEIDLDVEEEKAAEIKNQVQTAKNYLKHSNFEQPQCRRRWLKCNRSERQCQSSSCRGHKS